MTAKLTPQALDSLRAAGWYPGRRVEIGDVVARLESLEITVHPAARGFLVEYGDLHLVHEPSAEINGRLVHSFTDTDYARKTTEHGAIFRAAVTEAVGAAVCPVARTSFHVTIYVAEDGRFYGDRDAAVYLFGEDAEAFLNLAVTGRKPPLFAGFE
ncbi:SUKH-3 domain-containing protein [Streptomyces synnematoformans]|uniref:SUKH-3 immunity protein of toxin-antitoxin system n=1 Tax=Streptomyces synnematoformans TaxID=415721 RepID=A0ABN1ZWW1_9ACTN